MDIKELTDMWQYFGVPSAFALLLFVGRGYYMSSKENMAQLKQLVEANREEVARLSKEVIELRALLHGANSKKTILHRIICRHKTCEHYRSTDNCPVAKEYKDGGHDDEME